MTFRHNFSTTTRAKSTLFKDSDRRQDIKYPEFEKIATNVSFCARSPDMKLYANPRCTLNLGKNRRRVTISIASIIQLKVTAFLCHGRDSPVCRGSHR